MKLRNLTSEEISLLKKQGCEADDWMNVIVKQKFHPTNIWNVFFEGKNTIGVFEASSDKQAVSSKKPGIYNSRIVNCEIGDNVRISHVKYMSNYDIGDNCILEDVGSLSVTGITAFGNGTEIEVLNEGGGRTLPLFDKLSAQMAWLMVQCRHDASLIDSLQNTVSSYTETKKSDRGEIGTDVTIRHCTYIKNVNIGDGASLLGAKHLEEGTIKSCREAPVTIGDNVVAKKFIVQEGSSIDGGALITECFVGQAVQIGRQFSAENSAFFANSECFHGEACSLFAGPYTVTHHKSTLLIAGLFSFYNAGSGTNQSNHMYKLGPIHQGIVERGSKTGSFSYMLWPSRVGAYSVVMGKHTANFDAGNFPFSYITEEKGKSMLTPAMNLFTVGTKRDVKKWPARDKRKAPVKHDSIIFDLYSPYIMERVNSAINILNELYQNTPKDQEQVYVKGLYIHRLMLRTCRKYYELAFKISMGEGILSLIDNLSSPVSLSAIKNRVKMLSEEGTGEWLDVAGLFMPLTQLELIMSDVKTGKLTTVDEINGRMAEIEENYKVYKNNWFKKQLNERSDIDLSDISTEQISKIIEDWKVSSIKLNNMILKDAEKEFDSNSRIGYGFLNTPAIVNADFEEIHGCFEDNKFVAGIKSENQWIEEKALEIIGEIK